MSTSLDRTSIDPSELAKFSSMAAEWWDPNGKFKPLHRFNPVRLQFIRDTVRRHFGSGVRGSLPLEGLSLLDMGCGGGLLSEPMCRLGAKVTGADAVDRNIKTASVHAEEQGLDIDYIETTAEHLVAQGRQFDIVLAMEIVEHVADVGEFLTACSDLVKPGGLLFLATLNRTLKAYGLAIIGAEHVMRWLPAGTHDWNKFVTPDELTAPVKARGLDIDGPFGVSYNPFSGAWRLGDDTAVNYMMVARKTL